MAFLSFNIQVACWAAATEKEIEDTSPWSTSTRDQDNLFRFKRTVSCFKRTGHTTTSVIIPLSLVPDAAFQSFANYQGARMTDMIVCGSDLGEEVMSIVQTADHDSEHLLVDLKEDLGALHNTTIIIKPGHFPYSSSMWGEFLLIATSRRKEIMIDWEDPVMHLLGSLGFHLDLSPENKAYMDTVFKWLISEFSRHEAHEEDNFAMNKILSYGYPSVQMSETYYLSLADACMGKLTTISEKHFSEAQRRQNKRKRRYKKRRPHEAPSQPSGLP